MQRLLTIWILGIVASMMLVTMTSTNTIAAASHLGQTGQMGDHSSNPDPTDEDRETPRAGIGNVLSEGNPNKDDTDVNNDGNPDDDGDGKPDSKHPGDLADALCSGGGPLCP